jgi:hypothetical protein
MSDPEILPPEEPAPPQSKAPASPGPSLKLLYSLLALAIAAAIGLALLIVMPFYRRR